MQNETQLADGDNSLTAEEEILCQTYHKLGRPDLAACVNGARVYQRLDDLIGNRRLMPQQVMNWSGIMSKFNALTRLVRGTSAGDLPKTPVQFRTKALQTYSSDPRLATVIELERTLQLSRRPIPTRLKWIPWNVRSLPSRCVERSLRAAYLIFGPQP